MQVCDVVSYSVWNSFQRGPNHHGATPLNVSLVQCGCVGLPSPCNWLEYLFFSHDGVCFSGIKLLFITFRVFNLDYMWHPFLWLVHFFGWSSSRLQGRRKRDEYLLSLSLVADCCLAKCFPFAHGLVCYAINLHLLQRPIALCAPRISPTGFVSSLLIPRVFCSMFLLLPKITNLLGSRYVVSGSRNLQRYSFY